MVPIKNPHNPRVCKDGFTLLEVLIALCIIAIALTAAIRATTASVNATAHAKNTLSAHWVGMNVLSEIQTRLLVVSVGDNTAMGKSEMLGNTFEWVATTKPLEDSPQLEKITVKVTYEGKRADTVTGYEASHGP